MVMKYRYHDSTGSGSPGVLLLKVPAAPSFSALASMTVARVPSRMKVLKQLAQARRGEEQTAAIRGILRRDARPSRAAAVARFDPQARADKAQGDARLEVIARGGLQPKGLDARFFDDAQLAIVTLDDAFARRSNRARWCRKNTTPALPSGPCSVRSTRSKRSRSRCRLPGSASKWLSSTSSIQIQVALGGAGLKSRADTPWRWAGARDPP